MTGVEILSSEIIYNTTLPGYIIIIGYICVLICWLVGFNLMYTKYSKLCCLFVVLTICFLGLSAFGSIANKNSINHIEYKVTIDDSVSMNEFLDKYEILDQEGKIYTVKERE